MKLFRSAFIISFYTIFARITGFIRDILIAKIAGAGTITDTFFAAFKITNFFRKILAEGTLFAAFVPKFSKIMNESGKIAAQNYTNNLLTFFLYILIIITIIAEIFMPQITQVMSPGFSSNVEKFQITVNLSRILFIYFIFIVLTSVISGTLNSLKKFSYYAIVPIFLNLSIIVFIIFIGGKFHSFAHCLAYGVLFGGVLQIIFAYFACIYEDFPVNLTFKNPLKLWNSDIKETFKKMLPAMIAGGMTQINTMADLILGSYIESGVSYLYYADRIFYLPASMIGTAIGIVILPMLSEAVSSGKNAEANSLERDALTISSFFAIPASLVMMAIADILISIVFERGNFSHTDAQIVGNMIRILGVGLTFSVYNKTLSSIFFANGNTKTPMQITLYSVVLNIIISICLIKPLGVYGLITGCVSSYIFCVFANIISLKREKLLTTITPDFTKNFIKICIASIIAVCAIYYLCNINHSTSFYANFYNPSAFFTEILYAIVVLSVFGLVYLASLVLMGLNPIKLFLIHERKN